MARACCWYLWHLGGYCRFMIDPASSNTAGSSVLTTS
jgi:hypothetical protein